MTLSSHQLRLWYDILNGVLHATFNALHNLGKNNNTLSKVMKQKVIAAVVHLSLYLSLSLSVTQLLHGSCSHMFFVSRTALVQQTRFAVSTPVTFFFSVHATSLGIPLGSLSTRLRFVLPAHEWPTDCLGRPRRARSSHSLHVSVSVCVYEYIYIHTYM